MPSATTENPVTVSQDPEVVPVSPPHLAMTTREILEDIATGEWAKQDDVEAIRRAELFRELCKDVAWVRPLFDEQVDELHARGKLTDVKRIRAKTVKESSTETLSFDELRKARTSK